MGQLLKHPVEGYNKQKYLYINDIQKPLPIPRVDSYPTLSIVIRLGN
jgi:hypothetical protein